MTLAHVWGKPVYLVRAMPLADLCSWVQGCTTHLFDSFDELSAFLHREYGGS